MKLSVCAVFLLTSTRLFATVVASVGCEGNGSPYASQSAEFGATASISCPLAPISGDTSTSTAQASATLTSVSVFQSAAFASGSGQADYVLLVTGGAGTGKYMLHANGSYVADYVDSASYDIELGSTRLYGDPGFGNPTRITNLYGTFTYDVPEVLHFQIDATVAEFNEDRRSGSASASFSGISIVNNDTSPNPDAVFSLSRIPEPSFAWIVGLCLLTALRGREVWTRSRRSRLKS